MPRTGRLLLPDLPHHIVQRGHNRQTVFASHADCQYYLEILKEFSATLGIKVYAFCLMTNHVHLLLDPGPDSERLSFLMKTLGGRMTRYRNKLEGRSGTLWEGRFKSSPVQTDTYLLECCRYIELNPLRAKMITEAGKYSWSSYSLRTGAQPDSWLTPLPGTEQWGTGKALQKRYAAFVKQGLSEEHYEQIHNAVKRNQLTGNSKFVDEVAQIIGKRIEQRGPGRPPKTVVV